MKLPNQKRILKEDIQDAPEWIDQIIDPLNSFMQTVYQALNKNINDDNLTSQVKEITYITTAAYPTQEVIEFKSTLKVKATGLQILQIIEKGTYTPAAGPCYVPWVDNNGTIQISSITGLSASKTYIVRLRIT
jgi:hypothetical protein